MLLLKQIGSIQTGLHVHFGKFGHREPQMFDGFRSFT
jgi:hypothetical protein